MSVTSSFHFCSSSCSVSCDIYDSQTRSLQPKPGVCRQVYSLLECGFLMDLSVLASTLAYFRLLHDIHCWPVRGLVVRTPLLLNGHAANDLKRQLGKFTCHRKLLTQEDRASV